MCTKIYIWIYTQVLFWNIYTRVLLKLNTNYNTLHYIFLKKPPKKPKHTFLSSQFYLDFHLNERTISRSLL